MFRIELEDAVFHMQEKVCEIAGQEEVNLEDALGRIIDEDVYSPINNPPFNRSPLDGYALRAEDTKGASREKPITLKVIDEVFAGGYSTKVVGEGEAVRIMTGAKMPEGADAVIRQENTDEGMDNALIYEELHEYSNFCFAGEDFKEKDLLVKKGEKLSYVHIGILSSIGLQTVKVKSRVKVALFATGDEVQECGMPLREGKIYDSNLHMISARLKELGFELTVAKHLGDDASLVAKHIEAIMDKVDLVITTGGVSVGKKDIFHEVLPILGAERLFWKVNLQPGTPAMFSTYNEKPILSLSGNPFAALATFELLARPVLYKLSGDVSLKTKEITAVMKSEFHKKSRNRRFVRGKYELGEVSLASNKHSSGMLSSMIGCNCLIDIEPGNTGLKIGDKVKIILI